MTMACAGASWFDGLTMRAMFSDYKTRGCNLEGGCNLEDSQIQRTDRLDRLVMVLSLALYWAVSAGMWDAMENRTPAQKKDPPAQRKNIARSMISWFKRGLRRLQFCLQRLLTPPPLWSAWKNDGW
jgi:hypothetical protein